MIKRLVPLVVILVMTAFPALAAGPKPVFHFGKLRLNPVDMIAYQDVTDPRTPVPIVVIADFKIDRDAVMKAIHPYDALVAQQSDPKNVNFVMFRFEEEGRCAVTAFLDNGMQNIGISGSATIDTTKKSRVSGLCFTEEPGKLFDDEYDFRIPFDLPLTAIPQPTVLSAGGGDPGKALTTVINAIRTSDWKTTQLHVREEQVVADMEPSEYKNYFDGLRLNYPKTISVTGGLMKGDLAQVDIKAVDYEGKKLEGTVAMKKVAGNWRVVEPYLHYVE